MSAMNLFGYLTEKIKTILGMEASNPGEPPKKEARIELSDWYDFVIDDTLFQADILEECPIFHPPANLSWPLRDDEAYDARVTKGDLIIVTQSCDLVRGDVNAQVILCRLFSLADAEKSNAFLKSSYGKEQCRRGNLHAYHMIANCETEHWKRGISIISLSELYSLPLGFIKLLVHEKRRPRMKSPYREHFGQAFARYFMRVGLPVDIEEFHQDKDEALLIKKLEVMDPEKRKKIIGVFTNES